MDSQTGRCVPPLSRLFFVLFSKYRLNTNTPLFRSHLCYIPSHTTWKWTRTVQDFLQGLCSRRSGRNGSVQAKRTHSPHLIAIHAVLRPITRDVGAAVARHDLPGQQVTFTECSPHVQATTVLIQPTNERTFRHAPIVAWYPAVICNTQHLYKYFDCNTGIRVPMSTSKNC
jgi:hypothetical protein